jgi:isoleucyl-tRNA synthetase
LEVVIYTNSEDILALPSVEAEDWFIVSKVINQKQCEVLAKFDFDGKVFEIYKSTEHKCPRCWKFKAVDDGGICARCDDAVKRLSKDV